MSQPTSPLQRWILESQQALLKHRRAVTTLEVRRSEEDERASLSGE